MDLGAMSVSLAVKDIKKSLAFYEKLGFKQMGGVLEQNWVILQSGRHVIGLFQDMFDKNVLTFTPGWDQDGKPLEDYTDIRDLQKHFKSEGIELTMEVEEGTSGPASLMMVDPDGNPILFDQHV